MPEKAIPAGIAHLRKLMDKFDNNVVLALTAYNSGQQRVEDSIKKHKKKAVVSRLIGIPKETKNFIFWVLAVKQHYDSIEEP